MIALLILLSTFTTVVADEWTQFRGPNGTGVSETKNLPTEFGPKKNVVWKADLPPGHSSPVLTRDRIFVTAHEKDTLLVICLDRRDRKDSLAPSRAAHDSGTFAERQRSCVAESGH